jgi:serine/threonine protein kinase
VGTNPTRLAKIYREIAILREISHPNIVRLHEMVETEKHIGIILEYASGGELFDYILNHRYVWSCGVILVSGAQKFVHDILLIDISVCYAGRLSAFR